MNNIHRLAVYCGSAPGSTPNFADATRATAQAMTDAIGANATPRLLMA